MKKFLKLLWALPCDEKFVMVGVAGFAGCLVAKLNNVAFDTLWLQLLLGVFWGSFTIGAAMRCYAAFKSHNRVAELLTFGSFGLLWLIGIEVVVSWMLKDFLGIALYPITALYAVPCVLIFFLGLVCLGIETLKNNKQRSKK